MSSKRITDLHCFVVQVNNSKYGDSRITAPLPTAEKDLVKIKGASNETIVTQDVDFNELRRFQYFKDTYQDFGGKFNFKNLPPEFKKDPKRKHKYKAKKNK